MAAQMRAAVVMLTLLARHVAAEAQLPGFETRGPFHEQILKTARDDVRIVINAPSSEKFDPAKPTLLVIYALPNGNTIEQTVGAQLRPGLDWHYDIQHIGAQTRLLREADPDRNIVVAYVEADGRSWPSWRAKRPDNAARIHALAEWIAAQVPGKPTMLTLAAHSGGGSLIWGYLNSADAISEHVERIILLDANYSYSDDDRHGDKLLAWLRRDKQHRLIIMAYDDRNIELDGKKVVSDTGGTFRASHRMIDRLSKEVTFAKSTVAGFDRQTAMNGQIEFFIHPNPQNKLLHTTMVGEWNGFIHALTLGSSIEDAWGKFGGERAYAKYVQPAPTSIPATVPGGGLPHRPADAVGGREFMQRIASLSPSDREAAIAREISAGNIPRFLRSFKTIRVKAIGMEGVEHIAEFQVMPDYLAVGSDDDFIRIPMTPKSAQEIADAFGCALPTAKIVNDIYAHADVKLEPRPLTEKREAVGTFVQHHDIIEAQRAGKPLGSLVAGIKKDVVITNRLKEKPDRVAIYGWHKLDGDPIQPLTIVHKETYVDYSHGIRLVKREMHVDGQRMAIDDVLKDPHRCAVISDEGMIDPARYD
jgi:hypothetical protein